MNMNPVNGPGASQSPIPVAPENSSQAPTPQSASVAGALAAGLACRQAGTQGGQAASDSVDFSDDARKLAAQAGLPADAAGAAGQASSEERIAAARLKLLSGLLSGPAVYEKTAERLLRSGDLDD